MAACTNGGNTSDSKAEVYNSIKDLDPRKLAEYEKNILAAMLCVRDIYAAADKGTAANVVLADADVQRLVAALGENGYTVTDYDQTGDMQNAQPLAAFGECISAGQDAETVYYIVHSDGSVRCNVLTYNGDACRQVVISAEWDTDNNPRIYGAGQYTLKSITYTQKGRLILDRDITNFNINKKFNVDSHTLLKVTPYDETCRELCRKYISCVGYSENNLFTTSWQEPDFGGLDFNCLLPILYGLYHNADSLNMRSAGMIYDIADGTYLNLVPADEFENVIEAFFGISPAQIRASADFSVKDQSYFICGFQTGYYNVVPRIPEPEVVDYRHNADGTLTLTVDAVFSWYGTDRAFTHETTVRDTADGFCYVSNYVYPSEENIFPDTVLQRERRAQIARYK